MQIIGMIIGIAVAKYVFGAKTVGEIFRIAMIGWFLGLMLGKGISHSGPPNSNPSQGGPSA